MNLIDKDQIPWNVDGVGEIPVITKDEIEAMPTVDAVPVRHAYWIRHEDWEEEGGCGWECSECGMGSEVDYKFCMRCGARMDERKEK